MSYDENTAQMIAQQAQQYHAGMQMQAGQDMSAAAGAGMGQSMEAMAMGQGMGGGDAATGSGAMVAAMDYSQVPGMMEMMQKMMMQGGGGMDMSQMPAMMRQMMMQSAMACGQGAGTDGGMTAQAASGYGDASTVSGVEAAMVAQAQAAAAYSNAMAGGAMGMGAMGGMGDIVGVAHRGPPPTKNKLCNHFTQTGTCPMGDKCGYAHGPEELGKPNVNAQIGVLGGGGLKKSKLCRHFEDTGSCTHGARCRFAHGEAEIGQPQPGMDELVGMGAAMAAGPGGPFGPQWECACGFKNKITNLICGGNGPMGCKKQKPDTAPGPNGPQWQCACGFKNKITNILCGGNGPMGCKKPRAGYEAAAGIGTAKKLCWQFLQKGSCDKGEECIFAHSPGEPGVMMQGMSGGGMMAGGSTPGRSFTKSRLCRHWEQSGSCTMGERCSFAHGPEEIGKPQAERTPGGMGPKKMKICRHWEEGSCAHGDQCTYAHGEQEIGMPRPNNQAQYMQNLVRLQGLEKTLGHRVEMSHSIKAALQAAEMIEAGEQMCIGRVSSHDPSKGFAWIACEYVFNQTGHQVWCMQTALENCKAGMGDTVIFFLHFNQKNQPQVKKPALRIAAVQGKALKGVFQTFGDAANPEHVIQCPELNVVYGKDTGVDAELAMLVAPGQTVSFNAKMNEMGFPQAVSIEPVLDEWEATPGDLTLQFEMPVQGATYTGTLVRVASNFALIESLKLKIAFGDDVIVHDLVQIMGKDLGDELEFELAPDDNGKPSAINVRSASLNAGEPPYKKRKQQALEWNGQQAYG